MHHFYASLRWLKPLATPLAIAFVVIGLMAVTFGLLADEVHEGSTQTFDTSILLAINDLSNPVLDRFFTAVTELASVWFVGVVGLSIIAELIKKQRIRLATFTTIALGGSAALNIILKALFQRERPELWQRLIHESSFSFPSGHAMASSVLACCVVLLLWQTTWRWLVICAASLYVITIGISRLYLGVHYPTDIIAGWCVSVSWVLLTYVIVMRLNKYIRWPSNSGRLS
jgi:membrane-associated phospholipid phosphatase